MKCKSFVGSSNIYGILGSCFAAVQNSIYNTTSIHLLCGWAIEYKVRKRIFAPLSINSWNFFNRMHPIVAYAGCESWDLIFPRLGWCLCSRITLDREISLYLPFTCKPPRLFWTKVTKLSSSLAAIINHESVNTFSRLSLFNWTTAFKAVCSAVDISTKVRCNDTPSWSLQSLHPSRAVINFESSVSWPSHFPALKNVYSKPVKGINARRDYCLLSREYLLTRIA